MHLLYTRADMSFKVYKNEGLTFYMKSNVMNVREISTRSKFRDPEIDLKSSHRRSLLIKNFVDPKDR